MACEIERGAHLLELGFRLLRAQQQQVRHAKRLGESPVAGQQQAILLDRSPHQLRVTDVGAEEDVEAEQPQPARQAA